MTVLLMIKRLIKNYVWRTVIYLITATVMHNQLFNVSLRENIYFPGCVHYRIIYDPLEIC